MVIITNHWDLLDKEVGDDAKFVKSFVVLGGKIRNIKREIMKTFNEYNEESEGIFCNLRMGKLDAGGIRTWYVRNTK
jgi:hypothetical protein